MSNIVQKTIQISGNIESTIVAVNPILKQRELVVELDTQRLKVGDGTSNYVDLPHLYDNDFNNRDITIGGLLTTVSTEITERTSGVITDANISDNILTLTRPISDISVTLPVASSIQDGLFSKSDVVKLGQLSSDVESLKGVGRVSGHFGLSPSQSDLTTAWNTAKNVSNPVEGAAIVNLDQESPTGHVWSYLLDSGAGIESWIDRGADTVNIATNSALGTVVGTENIDGTIYVESNGSMSVNGWDALNADVNGKLSKDIPVCSTQTQVDDLADGSIFIKAFDIEPKQVTYTLAAALTLSTTALTTLTGVTLPTDGSYIIDLKIVDTTASPYRLYTFIYHEVNATTRAIQVRGVTGQTNPIRANSKIIVKYF